MISTVRALSRTILGKREWERLKNTIGLSDADYVYVLLDDDSIPVFVKNIKELKRKIRLGRLVAVVKTRKHYELLSGLNDVADVYLMSENGMKRMAYYTVLFERIRNMQIVSLDIPFGRSGSKFEDLKGLSKEELITIGLLDIPMKSIG